METRAPAVAGSSEKKVEKLAEIFRSSPVISHECVGRYYTNYWFSILAKRSAYCKFHMNFGYNILVTWKCEQTIA